MRSWDNASLPQIYIQTGEREVEKSMALPSGEDLITLLNTIYEGTPFGQIFRVSGEDNTGWYT